MNNNEGANALAYRLQLDLGSPDADVRELAQRVNITYEAYYAAWSEWLNSHRVGTND